MFPEQAVVSIIIPNWNGEHFLPECFKALKDQTFRDFEMIFVDNGSSDQSVQLARRLASDLELCVKIVELTSNKGFTGANIEGLRHSSGKFIALLNNDTQADPAWLAALVDGMERHAEVGICASKLIVAGTDIIDSAGDCFSTALRAFKRGAGRPASLYTDEAFIFGACAGAALYRKAMLDEIGFFDDDFFVIFEDADLNFRAQLGGWKCLYVPGAIVNHKVSPSLKKLGELSLVYMVRNANIMLFKDLPSDLFLKYSILHFFDEMVFLLPGLIKEKKFGSYLRGKLEFIRSLPASIRKRKAVMTSKKVPSKYIQGMLTSVLPDYKEKTVNIFRRKKVSSPV